MTFEELQANKVANEGENAQGQLSADEYNTLLERVQDLSQPGHGVIRVRPGQSGGVVEISVIDGVINITRDDANVVVPQGSMYAYINNPTIDMDSDDWTSFDFIPRPIPVVLYLSDARVPMQTSGIINVQFIGANGASYRAQITLYTPYTMSSYYAKGVVIITLYPLPDRAVAFTVHQAYNN